MLAHKDEALVLKPVTEIGFSQNMIDEISSLSGEVIHFNDGTEDSYGIVG